MGLQGRGLLWGAACLLLGITYVRADRAVTLPKETQLEGKSLDELTKVKAVIDKAIQEDPGNSELWVHLGLVQRKLDHVEDAQAAFEKAAQLNPRNANAHFMLGLIYEKKKMKDKAIAAWEACQQNTGEQNMRDIAQKHLQYLRNQ